MMHIEGFEKFREKVPAISGKKIAILPIYAICMILIAFAVYVTFDSLPKTLALSGINEIILSFFPIVGVIIMEIAGFLFVWQLWFWRDRLKAKYGPTSYQRAIFVGFSGVVWVLTVTVNQYVPYYLFAPDFWASSSVQVLGTPLERLLGSSAPIVFYFKEVLAVILFVFGVLTIVRAIQVFGFDYVAVVYVYFPEESKIQEKEIYSILRHPTYTGLLLIALGGAVLTFTLLSFAAFLILFIGFHIHIYLVEEKELIKRFGNLYSEYQKKVPAVFLKPKKLGTFLRFLFKQENKKL